MSVRSLGHEQRSLGTAVGAKDAVGKWEFDLRVVELCRGGAFAIFVLNHCSSDDLNALIARSVSASHVVVQQIDGGVQGNVAVLTIHVMCSTARVILQPDTEVLDVGVVGLEYLVNIENFTGGLLHLSHLVHEVPKTRLCHHLVLGKDLHTISWRVLIGFCWRFAADDLKQSHPRCHSSPSTDI